MDSLHKKVILITGASSGIGATTAERCAALGARLALVGRNEERLRQTKENCCKAGLKSEDVVCISADLFNEEGVQKAADDTLGHFQTVHCIINNAGIDKENHLEDMDMADLDLLYNINVRAPTQLVKLLLDHLKRNKGSVVNVSSVAAHSPLPQSYAYSVTKSALSSLTKVMALQLAHYGIRVNAVSPAGVKTKILQTSGVVMSQEEEEKAYKAVGAFSPFKRIAQPDEIANTIVFLASASSSYISGQDILIDAANSTTSFNTCNPVVGGKQWDVKNRLTYE